MSQSAGPILVIDDEKDICELVQLTLEGLGFEVLVSYGGAEGLQKISDHGGRIQLIFLDLAMPEMSGVEVLTTLNADYPAVPVIVMSGYVADKSEVAALGASDVLRKPFLLGDIESLVSDVLRQQT